MGRKDFSTKKTISRVLEQRSWRYENVRGDESLFFIIYLLEDCDFPVWNVGWIRAARKASEDGMRTTEPFLSKGSSP